MPIKLHGFKSINLYNGILIHELELHAKAHGLTVDRFIEEQLEHLQRLGLLGKWEPDKGQWGME